MGRLHRASRLGKVEEVADYLARGDYVDAFSVHDFTALMIAAQENQVAVVKQLLAAGGDPDMAHPNGRRALHFAASAGHLDVVRMLASWGAKVNALSNSGCTPAIEAAQFEHREVVALLHRYDADLSLRDKKGFTADAYLEQGGVFGPMKRRPRRSFRASPKEEDDFRARMAEEPSAEAYAAKHGRRLLLWAFKSDYFTDTEIGAWASRVTEIIASPVLLADCEEQFLSGSDLEDARKCRIRREKSRARWERRMATRGLSAEELA